MRPVPQYTTPPRWPGWLAAAIVGALLGIVIDRSLIGDPTADAPAPAAPNSTAANPINAPARPVDPTSARNAVLEGLNMAGVPQASINHGLYPLVGPGRPPGATLPLLSFACPAGRDCVQVLNQIDEKVVAGGMTMITGGQDRRGRPYFRAIAQQDAPALAIRAFPPGPRLTLIIEQVGREPALLDALLALDRHVTYAVAPNTRDGARMARRLVDSGREVVVDLPLEPSDPNAVDGPDFLTTQMAPDALTTATHAHLDAIPGAVGATVHLGGRFSASQLHVTALLEILRARGLFFVDDPGGPNTLAGATTRIVGVRSAKRTHHIDAHGEPLAARLRAVEAALVLEGEAIVILSPRPAALVAIRPWLDGLRRRQINLMRLSEMVR